MSETAKSKLVKIIVGLVVAAAGGGAAGAAGYTPDMASVEKLGVAGAALLVAYLHLVWWPAVQAHMGLTRLMAVRLGVVAPEANPLAVAVSAPAVAEPVDAVVEEQPIPVPVKRVASAPHLRAIKPHKDPT